eukprot:2195117-Rhodomonas_salina.3
MSRRPRGPAGGTGRREGRLGGGSCWGLGHWHPPNCFSYKQHRFADPGTKEQRNQYKTSVLALQLTAVSKIYSRSLWRPRNNLCNIPIHTVTL